jgi:hypothetical protein
MSLTRSGSYSILRLAHDAIEFDLSDQSNDELKILETNIQLTLDHDWERFITYFEFLSDVEKNAILHHVVYVNMTWQQLCYIITSNIDNENIEIRDAIIRLIEHKIEQFKDLRVILKDFVKTEKIFWLKEYASKIIKEN